MANINIRGITKETSNKIITVKILRLWISIDQQKKPVSIEAILMDSEGSKIPAYVKRALLSNFKKHLIEGETVNIANFESRATTRPDMWIQSNGLELIPFDDIPSFNGEYFIDIIGRIIRIGSIIYVDKAHARKLDIEIQDERNISLKVVLWESYADKLLEIAPTNDKLEVQTTMHATKMLINEDLPEFMLKVIATGSKSNDDITVVLFEDVVANLIGKSAATVLASLIEDGDEEALPMDFQPILFKDYLISIRVSREYNTVKDYNDYSVEHLTADEGIIGEYCSLAMNEVASGSKMMFGGCQEKYVGKGKEKAHDEYNDQGSNDISDTTITPTKRARPDENDEEVSIMGIQQSSTRVVIKKEKKCLII
ncbi:hypothetical protein OROHE_009607 [Orobanche hederae]